MRPNDKPQMKHSVENFVVIHLSTTAVYTVVARPNDRGGMAIMAIGYAQNDGFAHGKIVHRERLLEAIKKSIHDAEEMANVRILSASLCFATPNMQGVNGGGNTGIVGECIENADMIRTLAGAKHDYVPMDYYLAQFIPTMVELDDTHHEIKDPVGMRGVTQLSVHYHLMSVPTPFLSNMYELLRDAQVAVDYVIFDMIAGSHYALAPDEKKRGVIFVDIGADLTSVAIYKSDVLLMTRCIAMGGQAVTMDISTEFGVSMDEADKLKRNASLIVEDSTKREFLPSESGGVINVYQLSKTIQNRYNKLFDSIMAMLDNAELPKDCLEAGVVLAGGGSQMTDLMPYLRKRWQMSVGSVNTNLNFTIHSKELSDDNITLLSQMVQEQQLQTALGAMLYHISDEFEQHERIYEGKEEESDSFFGRLAANFRAMINWFKELT